MQTIVISSLQDLPRAARVFLQSLGERRLVAFYGAMGAGKTTFIKAVCDALGVTDVVNSPTFAIVNEYYSEKLAENVFHFDFYRIRHVDEVRDLGFDDYLRSGCFCLMEWPELVEELLPEDIVRVTLSELPDGSRSLSF
ncbi:MAG: tRNA (adenosine(37)-N6)-threonylcarbamoyltransferase complex ATPase subunit type 1 TsaE [Alloprevotella sp.]|nr:tRNA (adenosine(37)-N6)-threonylcarbamoyltransferase complex ATPase subunit type 1 TsaE [Alloprevotella sp.]